MMTTTTAATSTTTKKLSDLPLEIIVFQLIPRLKSSSSLRIASKGFHRSFMAWEEVEPMQLHLTVPLTLVLARDYWNRIQKTLVSRRAQFSINTVSNHKRMFYLKSSSSSSSTDFIEIKANTKKSMMMEESFFLKNSNQFEHTVRALCSCLTTAINHDTIASIGGLKLSCILPLYGSTSTDPCAFLKETVAKELMYSELRIAHEDHHGDEDDLVVINVRSYLLLLLNKASSIQRLEVEVCAPDNHYNRQTHVLIGNQYHDQDHHQVPKTLMQTPLFKIVRTAIHQWTKLTHLSLTDLSFSSNSSSINDQDLTEMLLMTLVRNLGDLKTLVDLWDSGHMDPLHKALDALAKPSALKVLKLNNIRFSSKPSLFWLILGAYPVELFELQHTVLDWPALECLHTLGSIFPPSFFIDQKRFNSHIITLSGLYTNTSTRTYPWMPFERLREQLFMPNSMDYDGLNNIRFA